MTDTTTIKADHPLAEIVGRYADGARRVGGRTFWLCPFHKEKAPSFSLTPDGGRYVCFGCGAGGDVIDLVMQTEGLSFKAAVNFLDGHGPPSGHTIPDTPRHDDDRHRRIEAARRTWRETGPAEGTPVEEYLRGRGITLPIPR